MEFKFMIGLIGFGTMGMDIAISFSAYGHQVFCYDSNHQKAQENFQALKKKIRFYQILDPKLKKTEPQNICRNIHICKDLSELKESSSIIESISEDINVKADLFRKLPELAPNASFYASNTSCISISQLAAKNSRPEKVIGLHFMNPVPLKGVVEAVRGMKTSPETEVVATELLSSIHKKPVWVNDSPGFVANRLSHLFMNEAAFLIQENTASANEIDTIFKEGYGHKMGPLETADLIGLDVVVSSLEVLYESYQDPKFRCCPLLKRMVYSGKLGQKSGEGFYEYSN
jgi:3-hydroxybutyryl-CoA dehydrogenase